MNMNGNVFSLLAVLFVIIVASAEGKYSYRHYSISSLIYAYKKKIIIDHPINNYTNIFDRTIKIGS